MASRRLLLQLGAVAAASSLLAATCPVDAALPPPSRDASATCTSTTDCTDVPRTVDDVAADISHGARRLGPPSHLRSLSDIPADITADSPAVSPSASGDVAAAAGHFQSMTFLDIAFVFLLLFLAALAGAVALVLLVAGLVKIAALLASLVAGLYAAARIAREKPRVRPLDQDAVEAAGL